MTDAQITRAYPDLPDALVRVAVLGDTLDMAKDMEFTLCELEAVGDDKAAVDALLKGAGLQSEITDAKAIATKTIVAILAQVSEQDLQAGLDLDLISSEDHREALTAMRTMKLQRGRSNEQEQEFEA